VLTSLLAWADGLSAVVGQWQLRAAEDDVHIDLTGLLPNGTKVGVYKGVTYSSIAHLVHLDSGHREAVTPAKLRWLADALQAT
jgi:hypothetical protein